MEQISYLQLTKWTQCIFMKEFDGEILSRCKKINKLELEKTWIAEMMLKSMEGNVIKMMKEKEILRCKWLTLLLYCTIQGNDKYIFF